MLDARTRVIAADIQWIFQKRKSGPKPWRNKYYFRSKAGLLFYAPKPTADELVALPNWFEKNEKNDSDREGPPRFQTKKGFSK
jgi:hypothetical protein